MLAQRKNLVEAIALTATDPDSLFSPAMYPTQNQANLVENMKAELQEVMNMLRKLQGSIDFSNLPMAEREELSGGVSDIMDALFEAMKKAPDKQY